MSRIRLVRLRGLAAALCAGVLAAAGAARSAEPAPPARDEVPVPQDLLTVLTLRGKPCGAVASYQRLGEADYAVTCKDGHRYRVYVSGEGRVVVEER